MKKLILTLVCASAMIGYSAERYELTVADGTQDLKTAMDTAYPDATLAAGDVIVKRGTGMLTDTADALALASKLTFIVEEGELLEGVAREGCTYSVSNGASVVVGVNLKDLGTKYEIAVFNLSGAGTASHPGALSIEADAGASAQFINYNLLSDATIYTTQNGMVQISGNNAKDHTYNKFTMNGHTLTFKAASVSAYIRFRLAVSFKDPGPIILDGIGLTHNNYYSGSYSDVCVSGSPSKIPCVKLINGARLCCVDYKMADAIACVDCEYGTKICKLNSAPEPYTLAKIVGCPEISAEENITVGDTYFARASDLLANHPMDVKGTLTFAEGAAVSVESFPNLSVGTAYTLLTAGTLSGTALKSVDLSDSTVSQDATSVSVTFNGDYSGYFPAYVPQGSTYDWATITNGIDAAAIDGKKLLKLGGGVLSPDCNMENSGLPELVISNGVYEVTEVRQLPKNSGTGIRKVTVLDGGTFRVNVDFTELAATARGSLSFDVSGRGFLQEGGSIVFATVPTMTLQNATYNLCGDTVFAFPCGGQFNFSSQTTTDTARNIFNMNGHDLTFFGPDGVNNVTIRFRYAVSFNDPGTLIFDHVGTTHHETSRIYVDRKDKSKALPVKLVNRATFSPLDAYYAESVSVIDCEAGTKIYAPSAGCTLASVKGCPIVTNTTTSAAVVTVTDSLIARASDIVSGNVLDSSVALDFASGCAFALEGEIDPASIPEGGYVVAKAADGMTGKPSSAAVKPLGLRAFLGKSDAVDALLVGKALGLLLSIH